METLESPLHLEGYVVTNLTQYVLYTLLPSCKSLAL